MARCNNWTDQTALYLYVGSTLAILIVAALHNLVVA